MYNRISSEEGREGAVEEGEVEGGELEELSGGGWWVVVVVAM